MKVAIVGSRSLYGDKVQKAIDEYVSLVVNSVDFSPTIISGGATGVDSEAAKYAYAKGYDFLAFLPDWSQGKSAGFKRNIKIVNECHRLFAVWDGESKGTKHSMDLAKKLGKPVTVVLLNEQK